MDDIWTIIGLSSLIASVVTVVLGILRDILVDKYHFKRQSEADYLRTQVQVFSQIYIVLARTLRGAGATRLFKERPAERMKEINAIMEANAYLLPPKVLDKWLNTMVLLDRLLSSEEKTEERKMLGKSAWESCEELLKVIADTANDDLFPRYRKIVGQSVGNLPTDWSKTDTS